MPAKNLQRVAESGIYCHIYNKGIENRIIFADDSDYQVFLGFLEEYLSTPSSHESKKAQFTVKGRVYSGVPHQPKNYFDKVELIAYNLKPNHFHLLIHQKTANSLQAFIRSLCTRYSMYFNKKYNRTGTLLDGPYKSVQIEDKKNLGPLIYYLNKDSNYSSYPEYSGERKTSWVKTNIVLPSTLTPTNDQQYNEDYKICKVNHDLIINPLPKSRIDHLEGRDLKVETLKPLSRVPELFGASIVFVALLGFGLNNVSTLSHNSGNSPTTLGTNTTTTDPAPTPSPEPTEMPSIENAEASKSASPQQVPEIQTEELEEQPYD